MRRQAESRRMISFRFATHTTFNIQGLTFWQGNYEASFLPSVSLSLMMREHFATSETLKTLSFIFKTQREFMKPSIHARLWDVNFSLSCLLSFIFLLVRRDEFAGAV